MVTRDSVLPSSAPTAAPMRFKRVRLVRGGSERESFASQRGYTVCHREAAGQATEVGPAIAQPLDGLWVPI